MMLATTALIIPITPAAVTVGVPHWTVEVRTQSGSGLRHACFLTGSISITAALTLQHATQPDSTQHNQTQHPLYFYHLKNIARIKEIVSKPDLERLIHAFVSSRLDYCNCLLTGLSKRAVRQLQYIQNATARVLTRNRKYDHISPVLRSLHWLPVAQRIDLKQLSSCTSLFMV